ncbi:MAG TPA: cupin domain-containing protein [Acidimicrobiales bacterium]
MTSEGVGGDLGGDPACWAGVADDERALVVDLGPRLEEPGDGVHWTLEPDSQLNTNLVRLDPGHSIGEHTNDEVDVIIVVLAGAGHVLLDGRHVPVRPHTLVHAPTGAARSIHAGDSGLSYLTVHRRRPRGLTIG